MSVILRERELPSGKVQLYLDYYYKGKRKVEALNLYLSADRRKNQEIRRLAEAVRAKRELQYHGEAEGFVQPNRPKLNVFIFAKSVYEDKRGATRTIYKNAFTHLEEYAGDDLTFEGITPKFCLGFKDYLLNTVKLKPNSAATYYERFKMVLRKATKESVIIRNPSEDISIKTVETLPKYLTEAQLTKLFETDCENHNIRNAFMFSCLTGMRYGDIASLHWKQIINGNIEIIQQKTGAAQNIPLHETAFAILDAQKGQGAESSNLVFHLPRRSTIDKALKRWAKRADIKIDLSFHKARHTFSTLMLTKGIDIYTVSKILGHKNLTTTQIYAKVIDEKKKEAINKLPSFALRP